MIRLLHHLYVGAIFIWLLLPGWGISQVLADTNALTADKPPELTGITLDISTSYSLGIEDSIELSVWQRPEFSRKLAIRPDGKITVELVGDITATGLTPMQLAADIQKQLSEYVINPQVTVIVAEFKSKKVYVQGEVNRPGEVIIKGKLSVLEAVTSSGSPTRWANLKKVQVIRGSREHPKIIAIDMDAIMLKGNAAQNILLQNGDVVFVPPKGLVKVGYAFDVILFPLTSLLRLAGLGTAFR